MAITLRNKKVEEAIRTIAHETGEGPSAVIARAIDAELRRVAEEKERLVQQRLAKMRAARAALPKFTEEEKAAAWRDVQTMYDEIEEDEARKRDGRPRP